MWLVLALIGSTLACNSLCETSCGLFNAHHSCYKACGCDYRPITFPVSEKTRKELKKWQVAIAQQSGCNFEQFESCGSIKNPFKYQSCLSEAKCQGLVDMKTIVENIPSHLWQAVQPKLLMNQFQTVDNTKIFMDFMQCNSWCMSGAVGAGIGSDEYFERYDKCNKQFCKEGYLENKQECLMNCQKGEVAVKECEHDVCGEWKDHKVEGVKEILKSSCTDECSWLCLNNGTGDEDLECYSNCVNDECETAIVNVDVGPLTSACTDQCYWNCYTGGSEDLYCYHNCVADECSAVQIIVNVDSIIEAPKEEVEVAENRHNINCFERCEASDRACLRSCSKHFKEALHNGKKVHHTGKHDRKMTEKPTENSSNLGSICYQQCYNQNVLDRSCLIECLNANKPSSTLLQSAAPKEQLTAGVTNCGQICFQTCYVNYQMISGCYNSCMTTCTTSGNTEVLNHQKTLKDSMSVLEEEPVEPEVVKQAEKAISHLKVKFAALKGMRNL